MIVGISGKARSGKDTFAEMLAVELNKQAHPSFVLMAFARELKNKCQEAFELTYEQLWGEDKEVPDKRYRKPITTLTGTGELPTVYWTAREIMQDLGAFYRSIDGEFWIKNLFRVAESKRYDNIIVTDVRYINEADYILNKGGFVLRVERDNKDDVHNMQHPSEVELDNYNRFDFRVDNNGTLEDLEKTAVMCARFLKDSEKSLKKLKEIRING